MTLKTPRHKAGRYLLLTSPESAFIHKLDLLVIYFVFIGTRNHGLELD